MPEYACPTCGKANATQHCPAHTPKQKPGHKIPERLRRAVLNRDEHRCQIATPGICTTVATHVDHRTPRSRGGTDTMGNLQAACATCNKSKSNR